MMTTQEKGRNRNRGPWAGRAAAMGMCALGACAPLFAATNYVDAATGSDTTGDGSATAPYASIQKAVDTSAAQDVILVGPGVYGPINTANKAVTIESTNGAGTTEINGGNAARCATLGTSTSHKATKLVGFTLTNGRLTGSNNHGGGAYGGTLEQCVVKGNTVAGNGGGTYHSNLRDCTLMENSTGSGGGGAYGGTLEQCLVTRNVSTSGPSGTYGTMMYNCTVVLNRSTLTSQGAGTRDDTMYNTIVWGNSNAVQVLNWYTAPSQARHSCITPAVSGTGNITAEPLFVDAAAGDFRLMGGSPCVNAGDNTRATWPLDFAGNARVFDDVVDMGIFERVSIAPEVVFVDGATGDDANDGESWGTAKRTIQNAVEEVADGGSVHVAPGVYGPFNSYNRTVSIESTGGAAVTSVNGGGAARCATMATAMSAQRNTELIGFSLTNGLAGSSAPVGASGGGALGGTLVECFVSDNAAASGGGCAYSRLINCEVVGNRATGTSSSAGGGGVYYAVVEEGVVSGNTTAARGGGGYESTLVLCFVRGNTAATAGGGAYGGTLEQCLVTGNTAPDGTGMYNGTSFSCTIVDNTGSSTSNGRGVYAGTHCNTIVWGNTTSNGTTANYSSGSTMTYCCTTPSRSGTGNIAPLAGPAFVDPGNGDYQLQGGSPCLDTGNNAQVKWGVDLANNPRVIGTAVDMGAFERVGDLPDVMHVDDANGDDLNDGASWDTARKTIQGGVNGVGNGGAVLVAPGWYAPFSTSNREISITGVDGAGATFVTGTSANRCATLATAPGQFRTRLTGFTLQGGTATSSSLPGGAVGGGVYGGTLDACVITQNTAQDGGGAARAVLTDCVVSLNTATRNGGAVTYCDVSYSDITGNKANTYGGAAHYGTFKFCNILDNQGGSYTGAAGYCDLEQCLVKGNRANTAGATYGGTTRNCTIVENFTTGNSGYAGVYGGSHYNSIIWDNRRNNGAGALQNYNGGANLYYSCTSPVRGTAGVGGGAGPVFMDAAGGDYQLDGGSECIDAGNNAYVRWEFDLADNPRVKAIYSPTVDIGAFEYVGDRPDTIYVDGAEGDDANDGLDWDTAKKTIQGGVNAVANSGRVIVEDGVYGPFNSNNRLITIESVNGSDAAFVSGGNTTRAATLARASGQNRTTLAGFTILNGNATASSLPGGANGGGVYGGTLEDCVIAHNTATSGGGACNSVLLNCSVTNNVSTSNGGGAHGGTLIFCLVLNNTAGGNSGSIYGGGAYNATLEQCLVAHNTAAYRGGGISGGTTWNCTIVENTVTRSNGSGAGTYGGTHHNTIIWENTGGGTLRNYNGGTMRNCCTTPARGNNCVTDNPAFISPIDCDYRIFDSSPCKDAGSNAYVKWLMDLDDNQRIMDFIVDIGAYENMVNAPMLVYVSPDGDDHNEGTSWDFPKKTIQGGIYPVAPGGTVIVTNGIYAPIVSKNRAIRIESVNGFGLTSIQRTSSARSRLATLATKNGQVATVLAGFNLSGGNISGNGGAVYGGTLEDCLVTANTASAYGGGTYYTDLVRCVLMDNTAYRGSAAAYGRLTDTLVAKNLARLSGAVYLCELRNCTVADNLTRGASTTTGIAGVFGGACYNTIVWENRRNNTAAPLRNYPAGGSNIPTFTYCTTENASLQPPPGLGNNNLPPMFINTGANNYRLDPISPCVNTGLNSLLLPFQTLDLDRNPRVMGGVVDRGAYEFLEAVLLEIKITIKPSVPSGVDNPVVATYTPENSAPPDWTNRIVTVEINGTNFTARLDPNGNILLDQPISTNWWGQTVPITITVGDDPPVSGTIKIIGPPQTFHPPGVIIYPDDPGDHHTGKIILPGNDGEPGTDDDITIEHGTYDPETGFVTDLTGPVTGGDGTDITDELDRPNTDGWIITDDGHVILPPVDEHGNTNGVLTITDDGKIIIPPGGEVWVFIPPLEEIFVNDTDDDAIYDPDLPGIIVPGAEPPYVIIHPPGVIIYPDDFDPNDPDYPGDGDDPFTGKIILPGNDGNLGTDDDITIEHGTYDPETGFVTDLTGPVTGGDATDITDELDRPNTDGWIITDDGHIILPPVDEHGNTNGVLTITDDGKIIIPPGGELWVFIPPLEHLYTNDTDDDVIYDPNLPGIILPNAEPPYVIIIPPGIIIYPDDLEEDPYTGKIILPGQDNELGTDDDLTISDGTYDPETGLITVHPGAIVTAGPDGTDPVLDENGDPFIVPPGSVFTPDGILFITPGDTEVTRNPDGTYNLPPGTDVWVFLPPMTHITTIEEPGGIYDPSIPAIIQQPGGPGHPVPPVKPLVITAITVTETLVSITVANLVTGHAYAIYGGEILDRSQFTTQWGSTHTSTGNATFTFVFSKPVPDAYFFHAVRED